VVEPYCKLFGDAVVVKKGMFYDEVMLEREEIKSVALIILSCLKNKVS